MKNPIALPVFDTLPTGEELVQITRWLQQAGLHELELTNAQGLRLRLVSGAGTQPAQPQTAAPPAIPAVPATIPVRTPYFGHLHLQDPVSHTAFAPVGQTVQAGQTVAVLDLGSLSVAVPAPCAGVVDSLVAQEGELVGYGQTILSMTAA